MVQVRLAAARRLIRVVDRGWGMVAVKIAEILAIAFIVSKLLDNIYDF